MLCAAAWAVLVTAQGAQAAAWRQQAVATPLGPNGTLNAVTCTGPKTCTAVGYYINPFGEQRTLAERWNGSAWVVQHTPTPAGVNLSYLDGIACTAENACVAVGASIKSGIRQEPLAERWNGSSWSVEAVPIPTGAHGGVLNSISCTARDACTAVGSLLPGEHSVTLSEHWNGTRWEIDTGTVTPAGATEAALNGVSCTGARACEAVGGYTTANPAFYPTKLVAEVWNGTKWKLQATGPLPPDSRGGALAGLSCTASSACTAVGGYIAAGSQAPNATLAERWNGARWAREPTPDPPEAHLATLGSVSCPSSTSCIAALAQTARVSPPVIERWNGSSWSVQQLARPTGEEAAVIGVSCAEVGACVAVGGSGLVGSSGLIELLATVAERWNGSNWTIEKTADATGATKASLSAVSCAGAAWCAAVGSFKSAPAGPAGLWADGWDGSKWAVQNVPSPSHSKSSALASISCSSSTACVAVGHWTSGAGAKHPLAERWNGRDWTIETAPSPSGATGASLAGVSCPGEHACTAVGEYTTSAGENTLAERWNGSAWTVVSTPHPAGASGSSLAAVSCTSDCWATGSTTSRGKRSALAELWNGTRWEVKGTAAIAGATTSAFTSVSCTAASACTAAGYYSARGSLDTLAERWNGAGWTMQTAPNPEHVPFASVSCGSASACTGVGGTFAGAWDGTSWDQQSPPFGQGGEFFGVSCNGRAACTLVGTFEISAIVGNIFVDSFGTRSFDLPLVDRSSG
jgi:hypothetical protein